MTNMYQLVFTFENEPVRVDELCFEIWMPRYDSIVHRVYKHRVVPLCETNRVREMEEDKEGDIVVLEFHYCGGSVEMKFSDPSSFAQPENHTYLPLFNVLVYKFEEEEVFLNGQRKNLRQFRQVGFCCIDRYNKHNKVDMYSREVPALGEIVLEPFSTDENVVKNEILACFKVLHEKVIMPREQHLKKIEYECEASGALYSPLVTRLFNPYLEDLREMSKTGDPYVFGISPLYYWKPLSFVEGCSIFDANLVEKCFVEVLLGMGITFTKWREYSSDFEAKWRGNEAMMRFFIRVASRTLTLISNTIGSSNFHVKGLPDKVKPFYSGVGQSGDCEAHARTILNVFHCIRGLDPNQCYSGRETILDISVLQKIIRLSGTVTVMVGEKMMDNGTPAPHVVCVIAPWVYAESLLHRRCIKDPLASVNKSFVFLEGTEFVDCFVDYMKDGGKHSVYDLHTGHIQYIPFQSDFVVLRLFHTVLEAGKYVLNEFVLKRKNRPEGHLKEYGCGVMEIVNTVENIEGELLWREEMANAGKPSLKLDFQKGGMTTDPERHLVKCLTRPVIRSGVGLARFSYISDEFIPLGLNHEGSRELFYEGKLTRADYELMETNVTSCEFPECEKIISRFVSDFKNIEYVLQEMSVVRYFDMRVTTYGMGYLLLFFVGAVEE